MRTLLSIAVAVIGMARPQFGAVQYYLTDRLTSLDPNKWAVSGKITSGAAGLSASDPGGGSIISKIPIPDGTSEAEVAMTLTLTTSGGVYT